MPRIINKLLIVCSIAISAWYFGTYGEGAYTFYGDAMGYYMYLPSTFIYHNHKALDWLPADKHLDQSIRHYINTNTDRSHKGYLINRYTYGVAAMEMPFFFAAHAFEKIRGKEANGYSEVYKDMVKISAMCYALLGLMILFRILQFHFDRTVSLWATLVVFMGTNLFWFTLHQQGMSHVPLFFLYALLIYLTILLHRQPRMFLFLIAGFVGGLITIIRPVDILCLLIPLLYNVYSRETILRKIVFLKAQYKDLFVFAGSFFVPLIPQMIYWKKFTGSFIYYSYGQEGFTWMQPHIYAGLFSFANGWLIYSPVMVFSIIGILLYRKFKPLSWILFIILPIYVYVIYCWSCYFYINGLGSRPMIHLYPLLAFPLAAFIAYISQRKFYVKFIVSLFFLFFIALNISYSIQQAKDILFSEESTAIYNMHMLFKTKASYADLVMRDVSEVQPTADKIERVRTIGCENYEDSTSNHFEKDTTGKSKFVYHMAGDEEYHPQTLTVAYKSELFKGATWIKCSGMFLCPEYHFYFSHLLTLGIIRNRKSVNWWGCKIDTKIGLTEPGANEDDFNFSHSKVNKWSYIYFYVKVPLGLKDGDKLRLDVWNIGKQPLYIDDVCLELYRDKK